MDVNGESKTEAERDVLDVAGDSLTIRSTIVYGPEELGKKFPYQLVSKLMSNEPFDCLVDQYYTAHPYITMIWEKWSWDLLRRIVVAFSAAFS